MSKLVFRLGVGIALVALAFVLTDHLLTPPLTPGVTEANVKRLRPGMTAEEVEAIMGTPEATPRGFIDKCEESFAGLRRSQMGWYGHLSPNGWLEEIRMGLWHVTVVGKEGNAFLYFRKGDRFRRAEWQPHPGAPAPKTGLIGRVREWLGW